MLKSFLAAAMGTGLAIAAWIFSVEQFNDRLIPADGKMPDGSVYQVEKVDGLWQGFGTWSAQDGTRYEGYFAEGLFSGFGTYIFNDGTEYKGYFAQGLMDGHGELKHVNGDVYQGRFKAGKLVQGVYKDTLGNTYEGGFQDYYYHGEGKYTYPNGDRYQGQFDKHNLTGQGTFQSKDGNTRYEGEFVGWRYHGQGMLRSEEGVYTGEFEYGEYHGQGTLVLAQPVNGVTELTGAWQYGYLEEDPRYKRANHAEQIETLIYQQHSLLEQAVQQVLPSAPGKADTYFLGIAGYSAEDVFLKELNTIRRVFDDKDIAVQRSILLVNNYKTVADSPIATLTAAKHALTGFKAKMQQEDVLIVYLTSHGSAEHEFSIRLQGVSLPDITPPKLAALLNEVGIRYQVVIVSACYSGGFIQPLAHDDRLVITAASADRKSFGCGVDSDMTYFGDAYFVRALQQTNSFIEAFDIAEKSIHERENKEQPKSPHSLPQIKVGVNIKKALENIENPD